MEASHGVRLCPLGPNTVRAVTHLDVDEQGIDTAILLITEALTG